MMAKIINNLCEVKEDEEEGCAPNRCSYNRHLINDGLHSPFKKNHPQHPTHTHRVPDYINMTLCCIYFLKISCPLNFLRNNIIFHCQK